MAILSVNGRTFRVDELEAKGIQRVVKVDGRKVRVELLRELSKNPFELLMRAEAKIFRVEVGKGDLIGSFFVRLNGKPLSASLVSLEDIPSARALTDIPKGPSIVTSPMAGRIVLLRVGVGSVVEKGQGLFVLEAMKMENEVAAPKKGQVKEVFVSAGALVKGGDKLALVD